MSDKKFNKILCELESIDYDFVIGLQGFNEPLSDDMFVGRLREIHSRLPKAFIKVHSNGDYLDRPMAGELSQGGLNAIWVECHPQSGQEYSDQGSIESFDKFFCQNRLKSGLQNRSA